MNKNHLNDRTESAWALLEKWARTWHQPEAPRYFAGSLGGTSLCQVHFGNVRSESTLKLLESLTIKILLARREGQPSQSPDLNLGDISDFLGTNTATAGAWYILASAQVPLPGGVFEPNIVIEKLPGAAVEVLITWVPLLAFGKSTNLKGTFFEIFGWLFTVERILEARKTLLCLERCPHPSTDSSAWMEI